MPDVIGEKVKTEYVVVKHGYFQEGQAAISIDDDSKHEVICPFCRKKISINLIRRGKFKLYRFLTLLYGVLHILLVIFSYILIVVGLHPVITIANVLLIPFHLWFAIPWLYYGLFKNLVIMPEGISSSWFWKPIEYYAYMFNLSYHWNDSTGDSNSHMLKLITKRAITSGSKTQELPSESTIVEITPDMSADKVEALVRNVHDNSEVIFSEGLFEVNLEVKGKKNVTIRGLGAEKTIIHSRGRALKLQDVKFVKGEQAVVIYLENSKWIKLENLSAEGGEHGILWINSKGFVEGCHSRDNIKGIGIGGIASQLDVRNSKSQRNSQGIVLFADSSGEIVGNDVLSNKGKGINIHSSIATINKNRIYDNSEEGIHLGRGSNGTITKNESLRNGDEGINIVKSSGTIVGNTCDGNGSHGIALNDESSATIENNSCTSNIGSGIAVFWSQSNSIEDNCSSNNTLYGICVAANSAAELGGNDVKGNKKGEIYQE